jgi:hypothetical protein
MSFSYSGNPATSDVDRYRFMLGDTDANAPILQDEEIAWLIQEYGGTPRLEYELWNHMATVYARDAIKRSLGPQSEDPTARLNYFKSMADAAKAQMASAGLLIGMGKSTSIYPKIFRKGMFDNKRWPKPVGAPGGDYIL